MYAYSIGRCFGQFAYHLPFALYIGGNAVNAFVIYLFAAFSSRDVGEIASAGYVKCIIGCRCIHGRHSMLITFLKDRDVICLFCHMLGRFLLRGLCAYVAVAAACKGCCNG